MKLLEIILCISLISYIVLNLGHIFGRIGPNKFDRKGYYIVRCREAGVFAGRIKSRDGNVVTMTDARRLWYWEGSASLSQLAASGTSKPEKCRFPEPVEEVVLIGAAEIIKCSPKGEASIEGVAVWRV